MLGSDGFRKGVSPLLGKFDDDDNGDAVDDGDAEIRITLAIMYHACISNVHKVACKQQRV